MKCFHVPLTSQLKKSLFLAPYVTTQKVSISKKKEFSLETSIPSSTLSFNFKEVLRISLFKAKPSVSIIHTRTFYIDGKVSSCSAP